MLASHREVATFEVWHAGREVVTVELWHVLTEAEEEEKSRVAGDIRRHSLYGTTGRVFVTRL